MHTGSEYHTISLQVAYLHLLGANYQLLKELRVLKQSKPRERRFNSKMLAGCLASQRAGPHRRLSEAENYVQRSLLALSASSTAVSRASALLQVTNLCSSFSLSPH